MMRLFRFGFRWIIWIIWQTLILLQILFLKRSMLDPFHGTGKGRWMGPTVVVSKKQHGAYEERCAKSDPEKVILTQHRRSTFIPIYDSELHGAVVLAAAVNERSCCRFSCLLSTARYPQLNCVKVMRVSGIYTTKKDRLPLHAFASSIESGMGVVYMPAAGESFQEPCRRYSTTVSTHLWACLDSIPRAKMSGTFTFDMISLIVNCKLLYLDCSHRTPAHAPPSA